MTARCGVLAAALGIALISGCTASVAGIPAPAAQSAAPEAELESGSPESAPVDSGAAPDAPAAVDAAPAADPCHVTISGRSVRVSNGGRAWASDGGHAFACRGGPQVAVTAFGASGIRFSADGKNVLVARGSTATVGTYEITALEADATAAQFDVVPTG